MNKKVDRFSPGRARPAQALSAGPATCASSRTSSSGRWCSPRASEVESRTCPLYLQERGPIRVTTEEGFVEAKERVVADVRAEAVTRFLAEARGNISVAAKQARITRRNFHRLLSKYSINSKEFKNWES